MDQRPPEQRDAARDVDALYREHAASLYAWACLRTRGLRPLVSPEDLTQEVWVRATRAAQGRHEEQGRYEEQGRREEQGRHEEPSPGEAPGPPRAWLFTIAKHALYEVRRAAERLRREGAADGSTSRLLAMGQVPVGITRRSAPLTRREESCGARDRRGRAQVIPRAGRARVAPGSFDANAAAQGAAGTLIACLFVSIGTLLLADLFESRMAWVSCASRPAGAGSPPCSSSAFTGATVRRGGSPRPDQRAPMIAEFVPLQCARRVGPLP